MTAAFLLLQLGEVLQSAIGRDCFTFGGFRVSSLEHEFLELKNGGLVQMIFLFNYVSFRFHGVVFVAMF